MKRVIWGYILSLVVLLGQTTGTLVVEIRSDAGAAIDARSVRIENPVSGHRQELLPQADGSWRGTGVPLANYRLRVEADGFEPQLRELEIRSNVPVALSLTLAVATVRDSVTVGARETAGLVDPQMTGTRASLSAAAMEAVAVPVGNRGVEAYLLTFPGFAMNANGAIHPRGAHNQMTYVVDGLPISDQLTGAFSTALDPAIVNDLELYTGDIPAEFGAKVSGVAVISSRSGMAGGRFAEVSLEGGAFDLARAGMRAGGQHGRTGWFASVSAVRTHRFLDAVSLDNLHNGGNAARAFVRLDHSLTPRDALRFNAMAGRSSFEVANLRSQQAAGMDQRQLFRDASFWMNWTRVVDARSTWETTVAWRPTIAQLFPSTGDTPVTASQARHLATLTASTRWNRLAGRHQLRAGVDLQRFHVSEAFELGLKSSEFNSPDSSNFNPVLAEFDLTRGGRLFQFGARKSGLLASSFVQDMVHAGRWNLSLGVRFDEYRFLVNGRQVQPRVGISYHWKEAGAVFRASYNRNYQTPPNENLLLSASPEAARIAEAVLAPIRPQRENVIEAGLQKSLFQRATLNLSYFHKDSKDQQDNNNFFDTGIIFPLTLASIRVNGAEGRLVLPEWKRVTASVSGSHSRAISTPPFTGGLFVGQDSIDLLRSGPFVIDHDQVLSMTGNVGVKLKSSIWTSSTIRYDSGLVAGSTSEEENLRSTDYRDLISRVDFQSSPVRVRPRTVINLSLRYEFWKAERRRWDAAVTVENMGNMSALYNFRSVFVGTRAVAPRALAIQMRFYF